MASGIPAPVVYYDARDGGRRLEVMRWGLIPDWTKDIKIGFSTINARAEDVDTKPAFRQRRCLVPLDSFYEWKKTGTGKQPYAIALKDRRLMGMAGLWETWRSPAGERIRSFTHHPAERTVRRAPQPMPVVLKPQAWPLWLGEQPAEVPQLKALLAPYPSKDMICWPVSPRVGNVKNNDPSLIEPIAAAQSLRSPGRDHQPGRSSINAV
jgi:putative SOS response-associated peptidase YedK